MTKWNIAALCRDAEGQLIENAFLNAVTAAGDGDIEKLLTEIKAMAQSDEAIPAENVTVFVHAAWLARPPSGIGRPPKGIDEQVLRLIAGIGAIKRNWRGETIDQIVERPTPGMRHRTKRELERCMKEARDAYGENLERWDADEDTE